jgi:hypothetical protein
LFNKHDNEFWNTSLILNLKLGDKIKLEYIPILRIRTEKGYKLAEREEVIKVFYKRSKQILQDGFIEKSYKEFAKTNIPSYIAEFSGYGKWLSRIDRRLLKGMLSKRKYKKNQLLSIQNDIECEAHRELLLERLRGKV